MTVLRFAPSPNGELHLGHAYSAMLNFDLEKRWNGRFLLRIEDIDTTRCTPEFEAGIYRDLEWLGLQWEQPVRRQSEHFANYRAALDRLIAMGLAYPAFMSRGEVRAWIADLEAGGRIWPHDPDGAPHYPPLDSKLSSRERQRRIDSGEPFAWRLNMEAALRAAGMTSLSWKEIDPNANQIAAIDAHPEQWGDVVIARSDIPTSYHLSVVVDDAVQGISHVVRGQDLYAATSVHRLLQTLLDLPEPLYHHHRLILDNGGRKLSKSERSTGLRALRNAGNTPADIRRMVGLVQ
jgi:glutamyl-Q tRNA(Asp) synthetase